MNSGNIIAIIFDVVDLSLSEIYGVSGSKMKTIVSDNPQAIPHKEFLLLETNHGSSW